MYSQFDHIRPTGMDGKNIPSNIQALCPGCHSAKTREDRLRIKKWKEKHKSKTDKKPKKGKKRKTKSPFDDFYKPPVYKPPAYKPPKF